MSGQKRERILIIGIGNPILSDDRAGICTARMIREFFKPLDEFKVDVIETTAAGLELIDWIEGYGKVILIDSIKTAECKLGYIYRLDLGELNKGDFPLNVHLMDIKTALELGKRVGVDMPDSISIYAIEILDNITFSEEMTPEVKKRLPTLVNQVIKEIVHHQWRNEVLPIHPNKFLDTGSQ